MEVAKISNSDTIPRTKKRRGLILLQLFIVTALLAAVWFSFGQNVLAPQKQEGVPRQWGDLQLVDSVEGSQAIAQINKLHGTGIELVSAYIAEYAHSSPYHNVRVTVWVGSAESGDAAAELIGKMIEGIERGGSGFSNLERLSIADHEVFRVDGPGGEHFFYLSGERGETVVWLSIEAADTLPILEQAVKTF